jgi:hypothetical protein
METLILFLTMFFSNPSAVFNDSNSLKAIEKNSNESSKVIIVSGGSIDKALESIR